MDNLKNSLLNDDVSSNIGVLRSAIKLFGGIKICLDRCTSFSNHSTLLRLSNIIQKILMYYINELKSIYLPKSLPK